MRTHSPIYIHKARELSRAATGVTHSLSERRLLPKPPKTFTPEQDQILTVRTSESFVYLFQGNCMARGMLPVMRTRG